MSLTHLARNAVFAVSLLASTPLLAQAPAATPTPTPRPPRTPESAITPPAVPRNPKRHEQFMFRKTQGEIGLLFLGDSITDGWPRTGEWSWLKFAPYKPADFGISGERTEDVLWRITNGELDGINPKVTVMMIGTNNFGHFPDEKPEWVAAGVAKLVETIHEKLPNTKLLLLGIFPRDNPNTPNRLKITEANALISKLHDGKKTWYLDITKVLLDEQGAIPRDVMPDLLHPNAHGYDLWYNAMEPVLKELLK